jgi:hypothetical protein
LRRLLLQELTRIDEWIRKVTLHDEDRRGEQVIARRAAERPR